MNLSYLLRRLCASPGFAAVGVLTLAVGIGANTAIFSLVDAVLLRPLPHPNPNELVSIRDDLRSLGQTNIGMSVPEMDDLRDRSDVFADVSAVRPISANLTGTERPERIQALGVSPTYFALLGAKAQLGRVFDAWDRTAGFAEAVILSDGLWRSLFGGEPGVLGKKLRLDNDLYVVTGVMPPGFRHPGPAPLNTADLWITTGFSGTPFPPPHRNARMIPEAIARLNPGVTIREAQRRLEVFAANLSREHPESIPPRAGWVIRLTPLKAEVAGDMRTTLLVVFGAVVCVLMICCVSIANLMVARALVRRREIAVRRALGATCRMLVWQILGESLAVALLGGAAGWLAVRWSLPLLSRLVPAVLPTGGVEADGSVLAFTLAISILSGLASGLAPVLPMLRSDISVDLKEGSRGATRGASHRRLRDVLVASEIALSVMLLAAAGLLLHSFWKVVILNPGFNPKNVLVANFRLPFPNDPTTGIYLRHPARVAFAREVLRRVRALPGVEWAALGNGETTPLSGFNSARFRPEGFAGSPSEEISAEATAVTPDFFRVLGTPLLRGRMLAESDEKGPAVVLVDEMMARLAWPNQDAVGKRFANGPGQWMTVVGIVGDLKSRAFDATDVPHVYFSAYQRSNLAMTVFVRTASNPAALTDAVRRAVQDVDPDQPIFGVRSMEEVVSRSLAQRRFQLQMIAAFAVVALLLAALGIYGVTAFWVRQRTHEIGIRIALGAAGGDVVWMVLRQGLKLTVWGVSVGLAGAVPLAMTLRALLFQTQPFDPLTFVLDIALLASTALLASYLPARAATRVDPIAALRAD